MQLKWLLALTLSLGLISSAHAQNPVLQSGSVTKGHAAKWSAQGTIQDAGPASGGNANVGITDLPVLGTGTPLCIYDAPKSGNASGYHSLCLGANLGDKGTLAYNFGGAAAPLPFQFCVNGNCYDFPFMGSGSGNVLGTSPSTMNGLTCFGNTTGTLIKDCDPSTTISTLTVSNLTATTQINSPLYYLNGKVLANGSDPFVIYNPDGGDALTIYGASNSDITYYKANSHIFLNHASSITTYIDSAGLVSATGGLTTPNSVIGGYIKSNGNLDVAGNIAASGQVTGSFLGSTGGINATGTINGAQYNLRGLTFASMDSGATSIQINDAFGGTGGHITMIKTGTSTGSNLYDQTAHFFRNRDGSANYFQTDGTGTYTASGTIGMISDDAVKENIVPYGAGLSALLQLNPVSFYYIQTGAKASANPFINTDKQYGLLASNVEPVLPEMVKTHKFFQDKDELKAIFPGHLSFVLINAVKEINTQVQANTTGMANFNTSITDLNSKVQTNSTAIATLNTQVQDNATAIGNLNTGVATLNTQVQDNATAIGNLNTGVATLNTQVQDNATAITNLNNGAAVLFSQIQGLDTRITTLEGIGKGFHFNTITGTNGAAFATADIAGSNEMVLMVTGAGAATISTPAAAEIIAAVPGWQIGGMYRFRMANPTSGTLTISPGAGVTITGLPTTASNKWREYLVRYVAANSVDFRDIGSGTD